MRHYEAVCSCGWALSKDSDPRVAKLFLLVLARDRVLPDLAVRGGMMKKPFTCGKCGRIYARGGSKYCVYCGSRLFSGHGAKQDDQAGWHLIYERTRLEAVKQRRA